MIPVAWFSSAQVYGRETSRTPSNRLGNRDTISLRVGRESLSQVLESGGKKREAVMRKAIKRNEEGPVVSWVEPLSTVCEELLSTLDNCSGNHCA